MVKNRVAQIVFQTVYCSLAIIALISSLGFFDKEFNGEFYIWYTNLSNYICIVIMFICLYFTIKQTKNREDGFVTFSPSFTFCAMIMILVTLLIYNTLLVGDKTASDYFLNIGNLLMHLILPIMFVLHWVLFYEHNKTKWFYPLLSVVMPLIYVILVFIRAAILKGMDVTLYPYFFINLEVLGWGGVIIWVTILLVVFVVLSYIIYLLDNINNIKLKIKNKQSKKEQLNKNANQTTTSNKIDSFKTEIENNNENANKENSNFEDVEIAINKTNSYNDIVSKSSDDKKVSSKKVNNQKSKNKKVDETINKNNLSANKNIKKETAKPKKNNGNKKTPKR